MALIEAVGVHPPTPERNIWVGNFEQVAFVIADKAKKLPQSEVTRDHVAILRGDLFRGKSGELEYAYRVIGTDPTAVAKRFQEVFTIPH